jgi:hypothetical protein
MKQIFILLFVIIITSCKEDEGTPSGPVDDTFNPLTATLIKSGTLVGVGHTASGVAAIYESAGKKTVLLDPYSSQNGPDLKVYLSKDEKASSYISLGKLKSIDGKQSYEIPNNPDVTDYKYVLVWCEQFTVIFGKAELK